MRFDPMLQLIMNRPQDKVVLETGTFYIAELISRLVAVYSSAQPPAEEPRAPDQT